MRRWLVCLSLLALALGCAVAPDGKARRAAPEDEEGPRTELPPAPEQVVAGVVADPTKRFELPPPQVEAAPLDSAAMRELAKSDPVSFLTQVIERYDREVKSYRVTLEKQERVNGKLKGVEVVDCSFREKPFSVRMDWTKGAGKASKTAYVEGKNGGKLLAMPSGILSLAGVQSRSPTDPDALAASRFPVTEFGIQIGTRRALAAWKTARKRGDLKVLFNGEKKLAQLNDRPVWEMKRVNYPAPEDDGITEATFYFDVENWLQIGSYLTGEDGKLIGSYYFRDLELNAEIPDETFTRAGLEKKK